MPADTDRPQRFVLILGIRTEQIGLVHTDTPRNGIPAVISIGSISIKRNVTVLFIAESIGITVRNVGIKIIDRLRTLLGLVQCCFIQVFMCQADLVITVFLYIGTGTVYSTAFTTGDRTDLVFFIERAVEIDLSTQSIGIFIVSGLVDIPPFRYQMFNTSIGIHDG